MFNPTVREFRFQVLSVRPCFEILSSTSLNANGAELMSPDHYYSAHPAEKALHFKQLGRRARDVKEIQQGSGTRTLEPHRFWSVYLSQVAHPDFRGYWFGFAPYCVSLDPKLLRVAPQFRAYAVKNYPGLQRITAFPKAYVTPLGWISAVSVELAGTFSLNDSVGAVASLRKEPAFLIRNAAPSDLRSVLVEIHRIVDAALLAPHKPLPGNADIPEYIVASPVSFDAQMFFNGNSDFDLTAVMGMLDLKGVPDETKRLITLDKRSFAMSIFNRGSLLIVRGTKTGGNEADRQPPKCSFSNFKNALMMTELMQRYHRSATGRKPAEPMRGEVATTFRQLSNAWRSRHFQAIVSSNTGLAKMLSPAGT